MHVLQTLALAVVAFSAVGISGSLRIIAQHNLKFRPELDAGQKVRFVTQAGGTLRLVVAGHAPDGTPVVAADEDPAPLLAGATGVLAGTTGPA